MQETHELHETHTPQERPRVSHTRGKHDLQRVENRLDVVVPGGGVELPRGILPYNGFMNRHSAQLIHSKSMWLSLCPEPEGLVLEVFVGASEAACEMVEDSNKFHLTKSLTSVG